MAIIKRILITGGAGFIGSHTVELLLKNNKEVVVLDNLFSGKLTNLNLEDANLEFIEGDILEFPLLYDLMESCDAVLHLAAIASVPFSNEDPIYSMQVNTQGFLHVLQAARKMVRPIRIVWASSAAVYGDVKLPAEDDISLAMPVLSPYALQKRQAEAYAELYARLYQIPSLALRYFNVYGRGQDINSSYSGVISRFIANYKGNLPIVIFGDGLQSRDFIAVQDVARANLLALESDIAGVVNIATGMPHNLLELIKYIENASNQTIQLEFQSARQGDIQASFGSVTKASQLLQFNSKLNLADGINDLIN